MSEAQIVPQNISAERAALSILHHSPDCLGTLPWKRELFFHPSHQVIFTTLEDAISKGDPIDLIGITTRMEAEGSLELAGGAGELTAILQTFFFPMPGTARYYFDLLCAAAIARETSQTTRQNLRDLESMAITPTEFAELIASSATGPEIAKAETLASQMDELYAELERREPPEAFSTGLPSLDGHLGGGVHRGEMLVVAGPTSGGKSIILAMAAKENAESGKAVAVFSLEMPGKDILRRIGANMAGMPIKGVQDKPSQHELNRISNALHRLAALPLTVVDNLSTLDGICAEAKRLARLGKADVVIIDYLQLVENNGSETREQAVSEVARKLKNLALSSGCAVFTASQLNEEGRLRESRAIGHHADQIISIGDAGLVVTKNRRGPREVVVPVIMRGELGRFEEIHR